MSIIDFYAQLALPGDCLLNKRIYKRMVLEHGQLTTSDKKALSEDVAKLTWKYSLKSSTVQVLPYEDTEREYLEVAIIEVELNRRGKASRIAETIQRAIPYPVLLVLVEGEGYSISVAHKRFSLAEQGRIVTEGFLQTPWVEASGPADAAFAEALALSNLPQTDFFSLYTGIVNAVLARICADVTDEFALQPERSEEEQRSLLEQCRSIERELVRLRIAIQREDRFAEQVELNTQIKGLELQLTQLKTQL